MSNPLTHEDVLAEYLVMRFEAEAYDDQDLEPLGLVTIAKARRRDWANIILSASNDVNPLGYRALLPGLWVLIMPTTVEPDNVCGDFTLATHHFRILLLRDETNDDMPGQRSAEAKDLLCRVIKKYQSFDDYLVANDRTGASEYRCFLIEDEDPDPEEAEVFAEIDPMLGVIAIDVSAVTTTQA